MKIKISSLTKLNRQHGFIMLALLLILVITGSTFVLAGLNNREAIALKKQNELHIQMEAAKASLLAYAANVPGIYAAIDRGPGWLPCPDSNNDGAAETACATGTPKLGRLPQYVATTGTDRFYFNNYYAGIDQQFWYAVSPYYIRTATVRQSYNRTTDSATYQPFYMDSGSVPIKDRIVALIIAPGEALDTQDRVSGPNNYGNYLESGNGAANSYHFYTNDTSNPTAFNDVILPITHDELMLSVSLAAANIVKKRLDSYHGVTSPGYYPANSNFSSSMNHPSVPTWFKGTSSAVANEAWRSYTSYTRNASNTNMATFYFQGCPGMSFTAVYGSALVRTGYACN